MRFHYLDTSALAKRYAPETGSDEVDAIITAKENTSVLGNISITELYSALSKKCRVGEISRADMLSAVFRFEKDMSSGIFRFLEIDNDIINASKRLILAYPVLRTYDSLHLALALELYALDPVVVTSDLVLYETCRSEGLQVLNPEK